MSSSSASVSVTARPRDARSRSPSAVTMRATFERRPDGSATTSSPGRTTPAATVPAKPRKSWFGRFTTIAPAGRNPVSVGRRTDGHGFEELEQRRARVPRCPRRRPLDEVVALQRRQRDGGDVGDAERFRELAVLTCDDVEHELVVADEIHLVHRQQHMADAQQRADEAVATRLREQSLRASTSTTAASAVEAPVAMLRVYCSCPGQSATMKRRLAVPKNR